MRPSTALPREKGSSPRFSEAAVFAVLFLLAAVSLTVGSYPIPLRELLPILTGKTGGTAADVFFGLRLPRVLGGIVAGGVLGVTGAVCQTVFGNPLASPDLTGVASGASFGAAAAILAGVGFSGFGKAGISFLCGMAALGVLLLLVRLAGRSGAERRSTYVLAGILVSAAADAGVMFLKTTADPEKHLAAIEFFTMGSFAAMTAEKLAVMALCVLPPVLLLLLFSRQALILSRGSEEARSVGVSPALWRTVLLTLSTWAVAGVVSTVGVVGFAGLIVPHVTLAMTGRKSGPYFVLCFGVGGITVLLSDLLARTVSPGEELPVSIFCVGFAVLWFLLLFCRGKVIGGSDE